MGADVLSIGRSSLNVNKKKLSTASHNISNANTDGYSRQRVNSQSAPPIREGNYTIGTGTSIKSIKRIHDEYIEKKLNGAITQKNYFEERDFQLTQTENIFNEINSDGLNKVLNKFFNSFRELSTNPESDTLRGIVRESAKGVTDDFRRISNELLEVKESINNRISQCASDINGTLHNISKLNVRINELETSGGETGDLRDQRDESVRTLSEFFKVQSYVDNRGQYVVSADGLGTLVSGESVQELITSMDKDSKVQIYYERRPSNPITSYFKGGKLEGLVKTRDVEAQGMSDHMDSLAFDLANITNAIHRRGFTAGKVPVDAEGFHRPELSLKKVTGIDFFASPKEKKGAASDFRLSKEVEENANNITVAVEPNSPADNRIAIAISKLQHEKVLAEGTSSFEESYLRSLGELGLTGGKTKLDLEQANGIYAQTKSIKERITGVSIDEETADMVRFQHAYEASARVIRVADEMFDAVIGMMR